MIKIESLEKTSFDKIFKSFSKAFADYEIQLNKKELQAMLQRRGFVPHLSFAAFKDDEIISFTLNGVGYFNKKKTAYDTGTGTLKEYRGQGLASKIFTYSIPYLIKSGISQYLLEVLQHNSKAFSIYKNMGFIVSREFNYFVKKNKEIKLYSKKMNPCYSIRYIDLSLQNKMLSFLDFNPSWQNSFEAILRKIDNFKIIGVFEMQKLIAYSVFEPVSGDITQIAVDKNYRRKGIASNLLKSVLKLNQNNSIKIINTEISCKSINEFLKINSIYPTGKQYEMIKQL